MLMIPRRSEGLCVWIEASDEREWEERVRKRKQQHRTDRRRAVEALVHAVEAPVHAVEAPVDAVEAPVHAVEAPVQVR